MSTNSTGPHASVARRGSPVMNASTYLRERPARQPRPIDRTLAFLDPLFARAALVVERDDPFGGAAHVGDDEPNAWNKLPRVPLDLGDHPARLGAASRLIAEVGVAPTPLIRRPARPGA